jgi:3-oxoacyl-[acyl-carrier protein] reductase
LTISNSPHTIVITGASSGIGREVVTLLATTPLTTMPGCTNKLILVGRDTQKLNDVAEQLSAQHPLVEVFVEACDFSDADAAGIEAKVKKWWKKHGPISALINSAGVAHQDAFIDGSVDNLEQQVRVNLVSPMVVIKTISRLMVRNKIPGNIVVVSSVMGLVAAPSFATYSATKFGLVGLVRAFRKEVHSQGITVSVALPSLTDTPMAADVKSFPLVQPLSPQTVAEIIVRKGLIRGEHEFVIGWQAKAIVTAKAIMPQLVEFLFRKFSPLK